MIGLARDSERPRIIHARGGYTIWRDHLSGRWRWACAWADDGWGLATHGAGRSLLSVARAVRRHGARRTAIRGTV